MLVMGAVVATMLYWPIGIGIVLLLALFGIPLDTVVTFGGTFGTLAGLFAWWLLAFVGALAYAACAFPWEDSALKK
jgi:hypothetical protein